MKIIQVVPRKGIRESLKTSLKRKERTLRGKPTAFQRVTEGRWKHVKYPGWINWDEAGGGLLIVEIQTKKIGGEWQLLQSFIGYLDRHLGDKIENISILYR
jgi:hypothetical protein